MRETCRVCGEKRPADAPSDLCPSCLLKAGQIANGSELEDVTILFGPATSSVLAAFGAEFGKIPPVLLRDADSVTEPVPVIRPSSNEIPNSAERSARLQLFGEIARGGMGAVLKGRDSDLGRDLAVKILLESHRDKPEMVRRFIEEAQIAGQLQHPGIVPVYELGAFGDRRPYFAMKLVKGHTLAEILANRKSLSEGLPRLLSIFESICQTMAYAHARGVIHRDLKPSNVMVGSFGEVQVMDWGLAKVLPRGGAVEDASAGHMKDQATVIATTRSGSDSDLSQAGSVMGTPSYMAPEQARGELNEIDERADVFALGSIFCEILTGQPAFAGRNSGEILRKAARGELNDAVARLEQESLGHDPDLIALAKSCLSPERYDRPRNAGEIAERISLYHSRVQERLRQSEIERAEQKARAEEATKRVAVERQRLRLTVALAASILGFIVLGGSAGFWIYQQRQIRLTALDATLARIQTLREQAISDGAESPRRREALVAADLALGSLGNLAGSDRGLRLAALRDDLTVEQDEAERGQKLLGELTDIRLQNDTRHSVLKADHQFRLAFQRYKLDLDTANSNDSARDLKKFPIPVVRGLVSNLDRWIVIRHDLMQLGSNTTVLPFRRILEVIQGIDPNPERNRMRAMLLDRDLQPFLKSLQETASEASLLDSGPEMPMILSRLLIKAGDSQTAVEVLKRSVVRYPGDLWTNLELARNLEWNESIRYYTAARALEPNMGAGLAVRLENSATAESTLEAIAIRKELYRVDPDNLINLFSLSRLLRETDQESESRTLVKRISEFLTEAVRRTPGDAIVQGRRAYFSLLIHDSDNAVAAFREVSRLDPTDAVSHYHFGVLLGLLGHKEDAVKELREAVRVAPLNPEYHDALASALRQVNDRVGEIVELREAIRLEEKKLQEEEHETQRGDQYLNSSTASIVFDDFDIYSESYFAGMWDVSVARFNDRHYDSRIHQFPKPQGRHEALGNALAETGDFTGAVTVYRNGIHLDPEKIELRENLAQLFETQGMTNEANVENDHVISLLGEQVRTRPSDSNLYPRLAKLLERRGKKEESIAVFREGIKAHPKNVEFHKSLADLFERQGMITEKDNEIDLMIELLREQSRAEETSWNLQELGMAFLRRSLRQEAVDQFCRVIELNPKSADAYNAIAWELATNHNSQLRDGAIAVEFATKACELTEWKNSMYLDTFAAAQAESGEFDAAVKWQTKAIELESNRKNKDDYGTRLSHYQEKKPFHSAKPLEGSGASFY